MNERIEKLAIEAGYLKEFLDIGMPSNMEKFARLIVQECIQFIEEENARLCEYQNSLEEGDVDKQHDCDLVIEKCVDLAARLPKHFGVAV